MRTFQPTEVPARSGIYVFSFMDGSQYVGGSKNMRSRVYTHLSWLRNGTGQTKLLQQAYNAQGVPKIQVLLLCTAQHLRFYEKRAHSVLRPTLCAAPRGGTIGCDFSQRAKRNISKAARTRDNASQSARQLASWREPEIRARRLSGIRRFLAGVTAQQRAAWAKKALATRKLRHGY